ncbi:MAG: methyltransferase domain-containing protein [Anaerolineales bacterium]|nr:methyltransferase domain-containing protein [Anaerolineales bacterium]
MNTASKPPSDNPPAPPGQQDVPLPVYDADYYNQYFSRPYLRDDTWMSFFGQIADEVASRIQPETVLDAGCALGFLVEDLRQHGIQAYGMDISEYAIQHVQAEIAPYCRVGSITEPLPQEYDLIICIEVLEHLPASQVGQAIKNLCARTPAVLFSSTPYDYKETTHLNCQPVEYWAEQFARHGFFRDVDFDASFITPWAVLYQRSSLPLARLARNYERKFYPLWKENCDLRSLALELRAQLTSQQQELAALHQQNAGPSADELAALRQQNHDLRAYLQLIENSRAWKTLSRYRQWRHKIAPPGSRLDRWLTHLIPPIKP